MKRFFIVLLLAAVANAAFSQTGTIQSFTGDVEIKPAGAANFTPARAGSVVAQDTIISTGFRSTAVIVVGSNTINVQPLTRLSLAEISESANVESLNVNLQTGRVRVEVRPPVGTRANTQVRSPSATASVRGTVFEMDTANLYVTEGKVLFMGQDGLNVPVLAGLTSSINMDGESVDPAIIAEAELTPSVPVGLGEAGDDPSVSASVPDNLQFILSWN